MVLMSAGDRVGKVSLIIATIHTLENRLFHLFVPREVVRTLTNIQIQTFVNDT